MSENLLDAINELITPGLLGQASGALGEPEVALSKGMGAVLPLLLGGVASRADDDDFVVRRVHVFDASNGRASGCRKQSAVSSLSSPLQ
jgi:hypothetical protein